jgi:hypothetical protein
MEVHNNGKACIFNKNPLPATSSERSRVNYQEINNQILPASVTISLKKYGYRPLISWP